MVVVICRNCGTKVSQTATSCVKCGAPPTRFKTRDRALGLMVVGGIVGGVLLIGAVSSRLNPEQAAAEAAAKARSDAYYDAKRLAERVIDECWAQQERRSFSPDTQRFVAGACEMGEEDYRQKYGRYYKRFGEKP